MASEYDGSNIRVIEGLEGVRFRPGMYIGSIGPKGLHHLVYEVVDNSIEEALAGYCKNIDISINANGSITVADDGRGIESHRDSQTGKFSIETIFTTLHLGKHRDCDYRIGGGLHGVGIAVVSALSSCVEVKVWRDGKIHRQCFERGFTVSELVIVPSDNDRTGTSITFLPDSEIFKDSIAFDFDTLANRFRELAYLHAGMRISCSDYRLEASSNEPKIEHYYYEGGLRDYIADLNRDKQPLNEEVIYIRAEKERIRVEVALQWCIDAEHDCLLGFANTTRTIDGGAHIDGLKIAITLAVNEIYRQHNKLQPDDANLGGESIREGLTAIVAVLLPNPEWAGPIKTKLANSEARGIVDSIVSEVLSEYFAARPDLADAIVERAVKAADVAQIRKRERDLLRRQSQENDLHPS
ncbi:ATP-binding protein [Chamaesiphon sp. GL140_3_metabinner_50]|uniref:ATP-binding protein n=1 Tax=Chamaesiphon sp. GL140_3_metabinner_50 TaxID=2970812 RepID=UPI0025D056F0|nr:ATP-binding protein [Chamaesiphon sp. GL140_3_metabinner_50]